MMSFIVYINCTYIDIYNIDLIDIYIHSTFELTK